MAEDEVFGHFTHEAFRDDSETLLRFRRPGDLDACYWVLWRFLRRAAGFLCCRFSCQWLCGGFCHWLRDGFCNVCPRVFLSCLAPIECWLLPLRMLLRECERCVGVEGTEITNGFLDNGAGEVNGNGGQPLNAGHLLDARLGAATRVGVGHRPE